MNEKSILYVSSDLFPYTPLNRLAYVASEAPKIIQGLGNDVRIFMPKFGIINERRHQLHEVIRLSGTKIIINDLDKSLLIKVASIPNSRLQVYFIDNEEYFKRKSMYRDDLGIFFIDNDERSLFFVKGVLEAVKKLKWKPDIIHVYGWFGYLLPLYVKNYYDSDPIFRNTKIILSIYYNNQFFKEGLSRDLVNKIKFDGIDFEDLKYLQKPNFDNLLKNCIAFSDGIIIEKDFLKLKDSKHFKNILKNKKISFCSSIKKIDHIYDEFFN